MLFVAAVYVWGGRVRVALSLALGVAGRVWFISSWRHHIRLSRDVDRSRPAIAPPIAGPCHLRDVLALSALRDFLLVFAETSSSVQSVRIQKSRNTSD